MKKVIFTVLAALMVVANWTPQLTAQNTSTMSTQERDELIGQLKGALAKLEAERASLESQADDADEVEGALSADVDNEMAFNMGSYKMNGSSGDMNYGGNALGEGNALSGNDLNGYSSGGYSSDAYSSGGYASDGYASGSYDQGLNYGISSAGDMGYSSGVPMGSYTDGGFATGQSLPLAPMQSGPIFQQAPMPQSFPMAAPIEMAPAFAPIAAPMFAPAPVAPINIAPAPEFMVQQPAPVSTFQPSYMNFLPAPIPMPAPRRHKCCLFGCGL